MSSHEIYLGEYIVEKTDSIEFIFNNNCYPGVFMITNYRVKK